MSVHSDERKQGRASPSWRRENASPKLGEVARLADGVCYSHGNESSNIGSYSSDAARHLPYLRGGAYRADGVCHNSGLHDIQGNSPSKLEGVSRRLGGVCHPQESMYNNTYIVHTPPTLRVTSPILGEELTGPTECAVCKGTGVNNTGMCANNTGASTSEAARHLTSVGT